MVAAIEVIGGDDWVDIDYTGRGRAQVAETVLGSYRLIVRRTKVTDDRKVLALFPGWRHHAFVTNRAGDPVQLDVDRRAHAVQELAIRDLKKGAGLNHCLSGVFNANAAWSSRRRAHNLARWVDLLGVQADRPWITKTLRRRLLTIPERPTRTARTWTCTRLPAGRGGTLFDDAV